MSARARSLPRWLASLLEGRRPPTPGDAIAGVNVALVIIPQSLAFAQLTGLPPERGLYTIAFAPLAAALTASSPYLQTGPTAVSSLLTLGVISTLAPAGSAEYIALAALLAIVVGVIRIAIGLFGAGALAYLLAEPVVAGFTLGSAFLIVGSQVPTMLGVAGGGNALLAAARALARPDAWHVAPMLMAVTTFVLVLGGRRLHPLFPGIFLAGLLSIAFVMVLGYPGQVVGAIPGGLPPLSLDLPWARVPALLVPAGVIAIVGFSEPATVVRQFAAEEHCYWDPNRELVSQGVANLVAGLSSGYPTGGSFSRSALNKLSGASTKWAGVLSGLTVLAMLPFVRVLEPLPTAVLSAIIVTGGLTMLGARRALAYWRDARVQFYVGLATFAATIVLSPHVERAILLGITLSIVAHLYRELGVSVEEWVEAEVIIHLRPMGVLYFASAPRLEDAFTRVLSRHPVAALLVVHLDGLGRIDLSGALMLRQLVEDAAAAGLEVRFEDVPPHAEKIVERVLGPARDAREDPTSR